MSGLLSSYSVFNVHGLKPSTLPSKVPYIGDMLHDKQQLFIALTETWLAKHKDAEISIDNYSVFRADRKRAKKTNRGRLSGGAAAYVRSDIACRMEKDISFSNGVVEVLGLYSRPDNLYIVVVYRQPGDNAGGNPSGPTEFNSALTKIMAGLNKLPSPTPNIIICGDFNLPHYSWATNTYSTGATSEEKSMVDSLNKLCDDFFLKQHINHATHYAGNTLDLLFTNNEYMLHSYNCLVPIRSVSDHYVIEANTQYKAKETLIEEKPEYISFLDNFNFFSNDIQWPNISEELDNINWAQILSDKLPDQISDQIYKTLQDIVTNHVPLKTKHRKSFSKIPRDRKILMKRRRKLQLQLTASKSQLNIDKIRRKPVNIEISLQMSLETTNSYREQKAIKAIKSNSKYFFAYAKKFSQTKKSIGPLLNENNEYTSSSIEMANILAKQYTSVFSSPLTNSIYASQTADPNMSHIEDIQFTYDDITDAIEELSNNSASGPDGIPAILLKKCKSSISIPLYTLYRSCLDKGITPAELKLGNIIPIHKGGHQGLAVNYRPIALTSHIIKVFEKIVRSHLVKFIEDNQLFNSGQHGFRQGRSCLSQLLDHYDNILKLLEMGLNVDTIYLDFSKAFDKVDHNVIMDKLRLMGISGKIYDWITSFLSLRYQTVIVNGFSSEPSHVKSGVPQGSVIGPLLFLVLISDINTNVSAAKVNSFADDTRATNGISDNTDVSNLQTDLNTIYQWSRDNNMAFNESKFELIRYGPQQMLKDSTFYTRPGGEKITEKDHVKDLGITMSNTGNFSEHINNIATSARDMCSWILRTFRSRSPELMLTTWKTLVLPILDYCSQLWCPIAKGQIQKLEAIQQSFTRKIYSLQDLNYWERLQTLRLYSLERRRERYRIIYVWKILQGMVPNVGGGGNGITKLPSNRNGVKCHVPPFRPSVPSKIWKLREGTINHHGARLFNALPSDIRGLTDCSLYIFKGHLDKFLSSINDNPRVLGYTAATLAESNSLLTMINYSCPGNSSSQMPHSRNAPASRR